MVRDIVVFERVLANGEAELDFRLVRGALPVGACPLAIANHLGFVVEAGQWFTEEEVARYAERESGHPSALSLGPRGE